MHVQDKYDCSPYLELFQNCETRKNITKFRLNLVGIKSRRSVSTHTTCDLCDNVVEHLSGHLLVQCSKFKKKREELYKDLSVCQGFDRMDEKLRLSFLLNVGETEDKSTKLSACAVKIAEFMNFVRNNI